MDISQVSVQNLNAKTDPVSRVTRWTIKLRTAQGEMINDSMQRLRRTTERQRQAQRHISAEEVLRMCFKQVYPVTLTWYQ